MGDLRDEIRAALPVTEEGMEDVPEFLLPAPTEQNWRKDLTTKQKKLLWELAELCAGFQWAENYGLRWLQQNLKYGINHRLNEFIAIDHEKQNRFPNLPT